jgi:hypothetical protein
MLGVSSVPVVEEQVLLQPGRLWMSNTFAHAAIKTDVPAA